MKAAEKAYNQELGKRLRASRVQCGLSQESMGETLGVTFQQIQKYEKGLNRIPTYKFKAWAKKTETNLLDLLDENGNQHVPEFSVRTKVDVEFVRSFKELPDSLKRKVIKLIQAINEEVSA